MSRGQFLFPAFLFFFAIPAQSQTLFPVNNTSRLGWTFTTTDAAPAGNAPPAAVYCATGFKTPPRGSGSLHLAVGQDGGDTAQARHNRYAGTRIDSITALSYSTFTEVDGIGGQSPYLILEVDFDANLTTAEDQWFFEPRYQSAAFFPANPQGPLTAGNWQTWNARSGGWWSLNGTAGAGPGANVKSFTQLLAAQPNATIASSTAGGALRFVVGGGAGAWDGFVGAIDDFRIGVPFDDIHDFEGDTLRRVTAAPGNLENWTLATSNSNGGLFGASSTIVVGPSTPPLGNGSLRLAVGADGADSAEARSNRFDGLFLRDLFELNYQTYRQSGTGLQVPYVILGVDYDNNGTQDDQLFFDPAYQTAAFCASNPQPAIATGTWQTWEAARGCWWSLNGTGGATSGIGVKPLAAILTAERDARLDTGSSGGAIRIVAGLASPTWDNFIGNVDAFRISFGTVAGPTRANYDFDPAPTISIQDEIHFESSFPTYVFPVRLNKAVSYPVTVQYATSDNTATVSDGDYTAVLPTTITFPPEFTSIGANVPVTHDVKFEADETFFVNLSNPGAGATISDNQALGTIRNDDPQPTISINDVTLSEGNAGTTNFVFTVRLSGPSASTITVNFATASGNATAGSDYTSNSGTLTFPPVVTTREVTVVVHGDPAFEPTETFVVNLTNAQNVIVVDGSGAGTITNDDPQPTISINDVALAEGDAGTTNFVFNVTLSNPSGSTIRVNFETDGGSADAVDYVLNADTITFDPLVTTRQFTIVVNGDTAVEGNETFLVTLSTMSGATFADRQGIGTIINDDATDDGTSDISITKTGPATVFAGQAVNYMITVSNAGPQIASNVVVTDIIPTNTTFISATPSQGTCSGTTTVTCNLGAVGVGANATITLVVRAPMTNDTISNTATATNTPETDPTPGNNAGTALAAVVAVIPTLSEWALIALAMALAAFAAMKMK